MFLKDTNGDGKADERRIVLHGFGTEDSHHAIHAFTWGAGGGLFFQEGTFLHSQVETPYGPVRLENAGVYRYEPRTEKLERVRVVLVCEPVGPRRRWLGPALHLGRVERQQLLGRRLLRPCRTSAQAADDEGVDEHQGPSDGRNRVRPEPPVSRQRAGEFPHQQRHRIPRHQAVQGRGRRLGVRGHRNRTAPSIVRYELPSRRPAIWSGRRALHHRLVQPARGSYAVLAAGCPTRQDTRAHLARHREGQGAERVAADPRRVRSKRSWNC